MYDNFSKQLYIIKWYLIFLSKKKDQYYEVILELSYLCINLHSYWNFIEIEVNDTGIPCFCSENMEQIPGRYCGRVKARGQIKRRKEGTEIRGKNAGKRWFVISDCNIESIMS